MKKYGNIVTLHINYVIFKGRQRFLETQKAWTIKENYEVYFIKKNFALYSLLFKNKYFIDFFFFYKEKEKGIES